ncbi:DUF1360 domain-containing protein [Streptomyces sp. NPDC051907]|uniref:DUF1360 domain-containing protein n=1 Tax=Streptomyces sp. NPDC051907 TaxID=3155284 RepID=UPI00341E2E5E
MASLSVFVSLLTLLAICRLTRLVTEDTITKPIRDWVEMKAAPRPSTRPPGRAGDRAAAREAARARHSISAAITAAVTHRETAHEREAPRAWRYLDKLLNCPWCAGFWVSAAVSLAYFRCWLGIWPHDAVTWFSYLVAVFASSWLTAILADWLDAEPPPKVIQLTPSHMDVTHRQAP